MQKKEGPQPLQKGGDAYGVPHGSASAPSRNHRTNRNFNGCDDPAGYPQVAHKHYTTKLNIPLLAKSRRFQF